jgi:hypothetical protein
MVRKFTPSSVVRCSLGACGVTGAVSFAAIVKLENTFNGCMISAVNSSKASPTSFYDFQVEGGELEIYREGASRKITMSPYLGIWALLAATKAAGTAKAQLYAYRFDTKAWVNEEGAFAIADAAANPGGYIQLGMWESGEPLNALYAAGAMWNKVLSKAEIEELAAVKSIESWLGKSPVGMWMFNQASVEETVKDLTGNGANQVERTGTTVSEENPPIPYIATGSRSGARLRLGVGR